MSYSGSQAWVARGLLLAYANEVVTSTFVNLDEVKNVSFSGSKYDTVDVTNYESGNFREWITSLADSGEMAFEANYLPADATQEALLGFFNAGTLVNWQITLPASSQATGPITFKGYVQSLEHNFPLDKEATIAVKIKITGIVSGF